MLSHIQIRDFAIIDSVELELDFGLTVLTGETGAGKSILVDALLLAAGGRAGAEVVRHGAERAEVSATFSIKDNPVALAWLTEQAVEHEDDEVVLRRVVNADGRSRAYVNGQSMPIQSLRRLGEVLVDVHGQMEYQSLTRSASQRELLDHNGGHTTLLETVKAHWKTLAAVREERDRARASSQDREARLELLKYHLSELKALDLKEGEFEELAAERVRLSQRGRLAENSRIIVTLLREAEDTNAEQALSRCLTVARSTGDLDKRFSPIARLLDESLIALREAVEEVERYESSLDADPNRQDWVESRLASMESLARKHRIEPGRLLAHQNELAAEFAGLEVLETTLNDIDQRLIAAEQSFGAVCRELTTARRAAALELNQRVTTLMHSLGMRGGRFQVEVQPFEPSDAGPHGADDVEFLVSANPGQPPRPLAKVASGGELSRISLAIQVAAAQSSSDSGDSTLPCLVFDEVDAGVGGGVAEIVGRQLRALGDRTQVLCVTHLPQVASQAHAHVRVSKLTDGKTTRTSLNPLSTDERIEEVARMLGGVDVTTKARDHAAEMLRTPPAVASIAKKKSLRR